MLKLWLCVGLLALTAGRAAAETYNLQLTGTILSRTCVVSAGSESLVVTLGNVNSARFNGAGSGSRYEPFTLTLEKCGSVASNVSVTFNGTADSRDPQLLAVAAAADRATGVGIAIYDRDKNLLPINTEGESTALTPGQAKVTLEFYARYLANGEEVTAGSANASATFMLNYA
ncbi:fimbrial protein [Dryocola clanedunensis]